LLEDQDAIATSVAQRHGDVTGMIHSLRELIGSEEYWRSSGQAAADDGQS